MIAIDGLPPERPKAWILVLAALLMPCVPSEAYAASQQSYVSTSALYQANGQMVAIYEGQLFQSADGCNRFVAGTLGHMKAQSSGPSSIAGGSVLVPGDASGYFWIGCITLQDYRAGRHVPYLDVLMDPQRASHMSRFPKLAGVIPAPPKTYLYQGTAYTKTELIKTIAALAGQSNPDARAQLAELLRQVPEARSTAAEAGIALGDGD